MKPAGRTKTTAVLTSLLPPPGPAPTAASSSPALPAAAPAPAKPAATLDPKPPALKGTGGRTTVSGATASRLGRGGGFGDTGTDRRVTRASSKDPLSPKE